MCTWVEKCEASHTACCRVRVWSSVVLILSVDAGRWKSATEAAQAVPKAVRSSVMTAKDYRERAQRMHQAEASGKDELEQAGAYNQPALNDNPLHNLRTSLLVS